MSGPVYCGIHEYMGFEPCPNCATRPREPGKPPARPIILNGERVRFVIQSETKPWWIPRFVWNRICRFVIRRVQFSAETEVRSA